MQKQKPSSTPPQIQKGNGTKNKRQVYLGLEQKEESKRRRNTAIQPKKNSLSGHFVVFI